MIQYIRIFLQEITMIMYKQNFKQGTNFGIPVISVFQLTKIVYHK